MQDIQTLGKKSKGAEVGNTRKETAYCIKTAIRYALANYERGDIKRGQALKRIMKQAVEDAINGDKAAREYISDRMEGKPAQAVALTGADGGDIRIINRIERVIVHVKN